MKFVRNIHGIRIKKCCASCINKQLKGNSSIVDHVCLAGEGLVKADYLCDAWHMNPNFDAAGKGTGQVKKKEYIDFLRKNLPEGDYSIGYTQGLRAEYLQKHGDIFDKDFNTTF